MYGGGQLETRGHVAIWAILAIGLRPPCIRPRPPPYVYGHRIVAFGRRVSGRRIRAFGRRRHDTTQGPVYNSEYKQKLIFSPRGGHGPNVRQGIPLPQKNLPPRHGPLKGLRIDLQIHFAYRGPLIYKAFFNAIWLFLCIRHQLLA